MAEVLKSRNYTIGDLFLDKDRKSIGYISKISQRGKGCQYQYIVTLFKADYWGNTQEWFNTMRLNDRIKYSGWIHVPASVE